MYRHRYVIVVFLIFVVFSNCKIRYKAKISSAPWTYQCEDGYCRKKLFTSGTRTSLESCSMLCSTPPLWPLPKSVLVTQNYASSFKLSSLRYPKIPNGYTLLNRATDVFFQNIKSLRGNRNSTAANAVVEISFICKNCSDVPLILATDESYSFTTKRTDNKVSVSITSATFYGARHGLETLSQLIWWDNEDGAYKILTDVSIQDRPEFSYRGLMVDVSRNFFTVKQLKKVINGMAATKLNVLHLHLSDTQSFPLVLSSFPDLAVYGSYGPGMAYTESDIRKLKLHAQSRGVRLVLEVDAPGHINTGWNLPSTKDDSKVTMCQGQLNPDNPKALKMLETVYSSLMDLGGQNEIFHIGGDEVDAECWRRTRAAAGYSNMLNFQVDYMNKMIEKLRAANQGEYPQNIVLWSSDITNGYYLNNLLPRKNIVVQYWLGRIENILYSGHSVIYSSVDHWYLDCGFGPWNSKQTGGVCDPYKSWRNIYEYRPWKVYGHRDQALGGEACLWSELVDEDDLETRIWPRVSALGERLWSDTPYLNKDVYVRLDWHRNLLKTRGLRVAAIWPRWCSQNPGMC